MCSMPTQADMDMFGVSNAFEYFNNVAVAEGVSAC